MFFIVLGFIFLLFLGTSIRSVDFFSVLTFSISTSSIGGGNILLVSVLYVLRFLVILLFIKERVGGRGGRPFFKYDFLNHSESCPDSQTMFCIWFGSSILHITHFRRL